MINLDRVIPAIKAGYTVRHNVTGYLGVVLGTTVMTVTDVTGDVNTRVYVDVRFRGRGDRNRARLVPVRMLRVVRV
jgi:hypothetical protein